MRFSHFFITTTKETPADAEIISHQLMLRSGMIRKLASGLYTWLPLGFRVLQKLSAIVREEMHRAGANEVLMPAVQPAELWQETGRWSLYGTMLLRMQDAHQRDFCFGPTHEEVVTDWVRHEINSYKQLPVTFYQIQTKFRDEIRPRFGVMRSREFLMKDAYSFNLDQDSLQASYDKMYSAYVKIFQRCGLQFRAVLADGGEIGGQVSHEFHVLADAGEDCIAYSTESDYAANLEQAEAPMPDQPRPPQSGAMELVATPEQKTIAEVCDALNCAPSTTVKTLIVKGVDHPFVAIILRGDHELNPVKVAKHPKVHSPLTFASEEDVRQDLNLPIGFLGPVNLTIPTIADLSTKNLANFVCGANQDQHHYQQVNWGRDCPEPEFFDCRNVVAGDPSPDGHGHLQLCRGIEVGHIFQLGDKYSKAMNATVLNQSGQSIHPQMGCYGIGVSRLIAAAIEQNHDEAGIIWPEQMAPFQLILIPILAQKSPALMKACDDLYHELCREGYDVLYDDRTERPGRMFADADLIGIPHRLVLSQKSLENNQIEYKARRGATERIALTALKSHLQRLVARGGSD